MKPNPLARKLSRVDQKTPMSSRLPAASDALDQETIAHLPSTRISEMKFDELVRLIEGSHLPFLSAERDAHIAFQDRPTLERLAHLARRCCLNRTAHPGAPVGTCH